MVWFCWWLASVFRSGGARKRYAGLLDSRDADNIEFVGMEVVRRDWTDLAKQVQRELYQRLFGNLPVSQYLAEIVKQVRGGELDDLLVYRKNLRTCFTISAKYCETGKLPKRR